MPFSPSRLADDAVLAFEREEDARRVYAVRGKRFAKCGLRLHPDISGQDPAGGLPRSAAAEAGRHAARAELRAAGVHPLLGALAQAALDSEAQDGAGPAGARDARGRRLVPAEPPPAGGGAVGGAAAEAAGPLRLLRHHRQLPGAGAVPLVGPRDVVQVAVSPLAARADDLGPLPASVPPLSPAPTASRAERLSCSYTVARGAGCANCARPDLWEPGAGDRPRPPGPSRFERAAKSCAGDDKRRPYGVVSAGRVARPLA